MRARGHVAQSRPESACNQFFAVITVHACKAFLKKLSCSHFIARKAQRGEMTSPRSHSRLCSVHSYYCCKLGSSSSLRYSHHSDTIQTIIIISIAICTAVKAGGHNQDSAYAGLCSNTKSNPVLAPGGLPTSAGTLFCGNTGHTGKGGKERGRNRRQ